MMRWKTHSSAALLILITTAIVLWLPAIYTPYWGDDYGFLLNASNLESRDEGFWSRWVQPPASFWRPLSQESYWYWVVNILNSSSVLAHLTNVGLLLFSGLTICILGKVTADSMAWSKPWLVGALSGLLYVILSLHFLPVHWVSAANSSILMIWTASALAIWIVAPIFSSGARLVLLMFLPVLQALALLSKESGVMVPLLMLCVAGFTGWRRYGRAETLSFVACLFVIGVWLALRSRFVAGTASEYEWALGPNLIRNTISLASWLLNVPREALRMALEVNFAVGALWIGATAIPVAIALAFAWRSLKDQLEVHHVIALFAFIVLAYSPYFPLAWNSYGYYAAMAVSFPVVVLSQGIAASPQRLWAISLICVSSLVGVLGSRAIEQPGIIARAKWAENTLIELQAQNLATPLAVHIADEQQFFAIGPAGLAWRLGLDPNQILFVQDCSQTQLEKCLMLLKDGEWRVQEK